MAHEIALEDIQGFEVKHILASSMSYSRAMTRLEIICTIGAQPEYQITVDNQVVRTLTDVRDAIKLYNETAA